MKDNEQMLELLHKCAMEHCNGDEALAGHFLNGFLKEAAAGNNAYSDWLNAGGARPTKGWDPDIRWIREAATEAVKGGDSAPSHMAGSFQKGLFEALGKGLSGIGVGLGIHGLSMAASSIGNASLHTSFLQALEKAIAMNPVLKGADKQKTAQYAETVFKFAPHVATDPNLLSSILANAIHGEGIDPMTIKTLGDLEARYVENKSGNLFSPKTYV